MLATGADGVVEAGFDIDVVGVDWSRIELLW